MKTSIIATGYSLKGKDLNKIEGHKIAVNYAFRYVDYDLLCAFDDPIVHGFPVDEKLHTNYIWVDKYNLNCNGWSRQQRRDCLVFQDNNEIFGRSGSLFCAINVAMKLGFTEIDVYGADMELTDGYCHFYDEEPVKDKMKIRHYLSSFERHKHTKKVFLSMLPKGCKLNFLSL